MLDLRNSIYRSYVYQCVCLAQACQKDGKNTYGLGDIKTASCDASQSDPSKNEWTIKLSYTGGQDSRKCDFNLKYKPSESTPEMTFDQEKPTLDYVSLVHKGARTGSSLHYLLMALNCYWP